VRCARARKGLFLELPQKGAEAPLLRQMITDPIMIIKTPAPPFYTVIFTSLRTEVEEGYSEMAQKMADLAREEPGFLGMESAREKLGITVSYWTDVESIKKWKANFEHQTAQKLGKEKWYEHYAIRIAKVERQYDFGRLL